MLEEQLQKRKEENMVQLQEAEKSLNEIKKKAIIIDKSIEQESAL